MSLGEHSNRHEEGICADKFFVIKSILHRVLCIHHHYSRRFVIFCDFFYCLPAWSNSSSYHCQEPRRWQATWRDWLAISLDLHSSQRRSQYAHILPAAFGQIPLRGSSNIKLKCTLWAKCQYVLVQYIFLVLFHFNSTSVFCLFFIQKLQLVQKGGQPTKMYIHSCLDFADKKQATECSYIVHVDANNINTRFVFEKRLTNEKERAQYSKIKREKWTQRIYERLEEADKNYDWI